MESQGLDRRSSLFTGRSSRRAALRTAGATGLAAGVFGLIGRVGGEAAVAAAELADNAALPLLVPFAVNVRQGPHAGTSFDGFLALHVEADGHAKGGLLTTDEQAIPVTGQVTGQSVGLLFTPADGQHIYGVGVASADLAGLNGFNPIAIGGTLVGPGEGDSGDWAVIPPGGITVGKKSATCKACLQSCRNGFGFGYPPADPSTCRDACVQFGDAGYGGCSADDFPPTVG